MSPMTRDRLIEMLATHRRRSTSRDEDVADAILAELGEAGEWNEAIEAAAKLVAGLPAHEGHPRQWVRLGNYTCAVDIDIIEFCDTLAADIRSLRHPDAAPALSPHVETLLSYAAIFEKPRRDPVSQTLHEPSEISLAAAAALRFQASNPDAAPARPAVSVEEIERALCCCGEPCESERLKDGPCHAPVLCGKHARVVFALLEPKPASGGWQPIETALKDGTMIEVIDAEIPSRRFIASWEIDGWRAPGAGRVFSMTHWRPLAAPPAQVRP